MNMQPPRNSSSHIHSLGFDPETGTMAVKFHAGGTYHYSGIDQDTFNELRGHESAGAYFHKNIKGQYRHRKVA
jgi:hypothetical protein